MQRLTPDALPNGVTTTATNRADGSRVYLFTHRTLGPLGNFVIKGHGASQTQISAEIAPGDPDAPDWDKKFSLFNECVTICANALPGGGTGEPLLPPIEYVRERKRLFLRFIETGNSVEMFGLAKALSDDEYTKLQEVITAALVTADGMDARGIRQRQKELAFYWQDLKDRPTI